MKNLLHLFAQSPTFFHFAKILKTTKLVSIKNIVGSARSFLACALFEESPVVVLTNDANDFEERFEEIVAVMGNERTIGVTEAVVTQIEFWRKVYTQEKFVAVMEKKIAALPALNLSELVSLELRCGGILSRAELLNWLNSQGYERVDLVTEPGEFAVRGSIIDVFAEKFENPIRIEFFGDEVVSLRYFDTLTQRSIKKIESLELSQRRITVLPQQPFLSKLPNDFIIILENPTIQKLNDRLPSANRQVIFHQEGDFDFGFLSPNIYFGNLEVLRAEIESTDLTYYIVCRDSNQQARLQKVLGEKPFYLVGRFSSGFIARNDGYVVLTEKEIYGTPIMRLPKRKFRGLPVDDLMTLKKGDYVVHINYGVGIFEGTKRLKIKDKQKDFLAIRYAGSGRLYLPVENLNHLDRYVGSEDTPPVLDRLGGRNWLLVKTKAQRAATHYAQELIELYARRMITPGFRFTGIPEWQAELEASFPFQETPDQLKAWEEVKKDMESAKVMDRLICGDVGFGKTEIALRAAFKAVLSGKQVAMLVPTTILCYQHYNTFRKRLEKFPVRVEMFSRLISRKKEKEVVEGLKTGKVDIVIGTHKLLKVVELVKNLGLLIIDEEQKFGVRQKEQIKKLKIGIAVLTLTATPIPRTLYMALVRLRDISTIHTPPPGRKEIKTEVIHWDDELIRTRIRQEIERGGQVFIVHNRIESLPKLVKRIRGLCPDLKIQSAHGRMPEQQLAEIYLNFIDGKYDILITTAIIESGIDMPRVNTIIVDRADWFGLADLHQLRGRVGRSKEQGYALFVVPNQNKISPTAQKRLSAILAYSQLDSGFRLALRDMEIRGIGNLLGLEQHGHINRIGANLYMSLLSEAIAKLKGAEPVVEPDLTFDVEAYIPEEFISDAYERVAIYRRLLSITTEKEIEEIKDELIDRFGQYPPIMESLFKIAQIRVLARKNQILRVSLKHNNIKILGRKITKEFNGGLDEIIKELANLNQKEK
ncbi:MAG: transcription-repair coupling factor [candidate division WOR-3 bacterium]